MSRYQKLTLVVLGLILLAVVALLAVMAFRTDVPLVQPLSETDQINTVAANSAATHRATLDAIATAAYACLETGGCPTVPPP